MPHYNFHFYSAKWLGFSHRSLLLFDCQHFSKRVFSYQLPTLGGFPSDARLHFHQYTMPTHFYMNTYLSTSLFLVEVKTRFLCSHAAQNLLEMNFFSKYMYIRCEGSGRDERWMWRHRLQKDCCVEVWWLKGVQHAVLTAKCFIGLQANQLNLIVYEYLCLPIRLRTNGEP